MRGARRVAAVLLTASLALAGCAAADSGDIAERSLTDAKGAERAEGAEGAADSGYEQTAPDAVKGPGAAAKSPDADKGKSAAPQQHVIRTAELFVEVEDASKALATARRVTAGAGGQVSNESTERVDDTHVTSRIVLRVPQERYESVLGELSGTGKLLSRTADAKDVTEQVVDVESRIATQRASVARVRALMDRATKLSDVVTLEGELSRRQADLESLLAQQASLKDRTSLSTITLELTEKEKEKAAGKDDRPGLLDALAGGWDALVTALAWVAIVLAAVAPWLAVAVVLYVVWRRLLRPRLRRRAAAAPNAAPTPDTGTGTAASPAPVPAPASGPDAPSAQRRD
ncbi:DUF4349 domain-containing protein [Streptomyces sp. ISL-36]|uniref:DUF4349 domain-containing protein n=1 Tax=Streptomyces sp. ISL-36 TaxID=2819182 RepID=UPI001BEA7AB1|nr:DUF4349 domain-containing protein [Streptomyces sp. ISL-36]MBT2440010.1 DUF4349 domain-containing protein [Streptomyces sp. ISL-36]